MAAFEPEPERPIQLNNIRDLIDGGERSAAIIQTVVGYPEEFWDYIKDMDKKEPAEKCKNLIYSDNEYEKLARDKEENWWIKQRRAKIICDFLMFWSKEANRGPINEFIHDNGNLREGAYAGIQTQIANDLDNLDALYNQLAAAPAPAAAPAAAAAAAAVNDLMEKIKTTSMRLFTFAAFVAKSVGVACKAAGGAAVDTASATVAVIDQLLGQLINMDITIHIPAAAGASKVFIDSIVGHHIDTVILMLEGLVTVCAGTLAVQNYQVVFNRLLSLLTYLETLLKAAGVSAVLYAIGSIANLLTKVLKVEGLKVYDVIKEKADELAVISKEITAIQGKDVNETTVGDLVIRLRELVDSAAHALPAVEGAEGPDGASLKRPAEAEAAANKKAKPGVLDGTLSGGKKHAKSQKRPRRKASKSNRSKKAGKKTRKRSRGKSHGKSRGKKH
jgi:hypothetical protein